MTSTALRDRVIERDAIFLWERYLDLKEWFETGSAHTYDQWRRLHRIVCIVPAIDPDNPDPCGGTQEVDHVKDQPMMGKRAPDDEFHLVAMCQNHNTWHPPRRELRQAEREYLARCRSALKP